MFSLKPVPSKKAILSLPRSFRGTERIDHYKSGKVLSRDFMDKNMIKLIDAVTFR